VARGDFAHLVIATGVESSPSQGGVVGVGARRAPVECHLLSAVPDLEVASLVLEGEADDEGGEGSSGGGGGRIG